MFEPRLRAPKQRAATRGVRVLVVWASGPKEELTKSFVDMTGTSDMRRLLGMEFGYGVGGVWKQRAEQSES